MTLQDIGIALMVAMIWGANFVVAKIGLQHLPPLLLMGLRFLLVAVALLPFYWRPKYPWKDVALIACTYGVGYHGLLFTGLAKGLDVASSIITVQLNVPFTSLLGAWLLKDRLGWKQLTGMGVAFLGIIIIVGSPLILQNFAAFTYVVGAAICWAVFNVHIKRLGNIDILHFLTWVSLLAAPQLFFLSAIYESHQMQLLQKIPFSALFSIGYMAFLSTLLGFGWWFKLLKRYSVHQVAPFSMIMPVFGIVAAILYLHTERLTWQVALGGITTFIGVGIMVLRKRKTLYATVNLTD